MSDKSSDIRVPLLGTNPNPNQNDPAPDMTAQPGGQHADYWVLSKSERAKGFVRPVRRAYQHTKCGTITTMGVAIAETYAREPGFYGSTFCVSCGIHSPVGKNGEFVWIDEFDKPTTEKVGT